MTVDRCGSRPWWRDAVFYEIYVRSFADSDGDGVGDLAGIRSRLPYLCDLGGSSSTVEVGDAVAKQVQDG